MTAAAGAPVLAPESPPRRRLGRLVDLVPAAFAIVGEAAWVWIVAGILQEFALAEAPVGFPLIVAAVGLGAATGHSLGPRLGDRWPIGAAVVAIGAGAIGWLSAPEARVALEAASVERAITANPAGWLATLGVVRGYRHTRLPLHEPTLATILALGIPGIAVAAVAGGMIVEPFRSRFLADALVGATLFVTCTTVALALTRLSAAGAHAGFDWRRNPPWLLVVLVLVAAVAVVAYPAATVAGPLVTLAVGILAGPFLLVALVLGFSRRAAVISLVGGAVALAAIGLAGMVVGDEPVRPGEVGNQIGTEVEERVAIDPVELTAVILLVATIAIVILVRLWMRRTSSADIQSDETRTIDRGADDARPAARRRRWRWRTIAPNDAVAAYRALDGELRHDPLVARRSGETPGEHARRLRADGRAGLGLALLAADYALVRFGGVRLSPAEDRRAVERWRRLRRALRAPAPSRPRSPDATRAADQTS